MKAKAFFWKVFCIKFTLIAVYFCAGCSRPEVLRQSYLPAYHQGNFEIAENALTQIVEKEIPKNDFRKSNDALWILLDRATVRLAAGKTDQSITDYQLALEALDYYRKDELTEAVGQIVLEDSVAAYAGQDFEQILARIYFALALLQKGDENNASAILRQAEDAQELKRQQYRKNRATETYTLVDNALGKYLFALALEKRGDISNARILYKQAEKLINSPQIAQDIEELDNSPSKKRKLATVLVIAHNGKAPHKISTTAPASIASGAALEILLHTQKIPVAWSSLGGIPVPEFAETENGQPSTLYATLGQTQKTMQPWYNIDAVARAQLERDLPVIVARGVARFLARRGLVGIAQHQDQLAGGILDIAMLASNLAAQADTRLWSTLPCRLDLARFDVLPGLYPLKVTSNSIQSNSVDDSQHLNLSSGDLCVINVFHFLPSVHRIHIPSRFLLDAPHSQKSNTSGQKVAE